MTARVRKQKKTPETKAISRSMNAVCDGAAGSMGMGIDVDVERMVGFPYL